MFPRPAGTSVIEGCKISAEGVKALSSAAADCWNAIMNMDLPAFAKAYQASFEAQISMFPAMMNYRIKEYIDQYRNQVLAWKMSGAGGGGYLAVVYDGQKPEAGFPIKIRRRGMI
jgi:galactokinase/mevalonate kinase-like predicted kinase